MQKEKNWKKNWENTAGYNSYCYSETEILEVMHKIAIKKVKV